MPNILSSWNKVIINIIVIIIHYLYYYYYEFDIYLAHRVLEI